MRTSSARFPLALHVSSSQGTQSSYLESLIVVLPHGYRLCQIRAEDGRSKWIPWPPQKMEVKSLPAWFNPSLTPNFYLCFYNSIPNFHINQLIELQMNLIIRISIFIQLFCMIPQATTRHNKKILNQTMWQTLLPFSVSHDIRIFKSKRTLHTHCWSTFYHVFGIPTTPRSPKIS